MLYICPTTSIFQNWDYITHMSGWHIWQYMREKRVVGWARGDWLFATSFLLLLLFELSLYFTKQIFSVQFEIQMERVKHCFQNSLKLLHSINYFIWSHREKVLTANNKTWMFQNAVLIRLEFDGIISLTSP